MIYVCSDHLPVRLALKTDYVNNNVNYFDFKNANWKRFSKFINRNICLYNNNVYSSKEMVDSALHQFIDTLNDAVRQSVPQKQKRRVGKTLPNNIKLLMRNRNHFRRKWLRYRDDCDYYEFKTLNSVIKSEITKFRNNSWNQVLSSLEKKLFSFLEFNKNFKEEIQKYSNVKA